MSAEYDAALEIRAVLDPIRDAVERIAAALLRMADSLEVIEKQLLEFLDRTTVLMHRVALVRGPAQAQAQQPVTLPLDYATFEAGWKAGAGLTHQGLVCADAFDAWRRVQAAPKGGA
jgi:hypothetical protein